MIRVLGSNFFIRVGQAWPTSEPSSFIQAWDWLNCLSLWKKGIEAELKKCLLSGADTEEARIRRLR